MRETGQEAPPFTRYKSIRADKTTLYCPFQRLFGTLSAWQVETTVAVSVGQQPGNVERELGVVLVCSKHLDRCGDTVNSTNY